MNPSPAQWLQWLFTIWYKLKMMEKERGILNNQEYRFRRWVVILEFLDRLCIIIAFRLAQSRLKSSLWDSVQFYLIQFLLPPWGITIWLWPMSVTLATITSTCIRFSISNLNEFKWFHMPCKITFFISR